MSGPVDVVGVFDSNLNQLFVDARPMKAIVKEIAKVMEHPAETGVTFADHFVFMPTEIELAVTLRPATFQNTYQQIKQTWQGANLITVTTKTDTYSNMIIAEMPHDEDIDQFDTVTMGIKLRNALLVQAQFQQLTNVATPRHKSTVKTGQQNPAAATPAQSSALYSLIFGNG